MLEKTLKSKTVFSGRLLKVEMIDVQIGPEKRSRREIVRHPGAAVVLARRADGRFVFVRQFRKAVEKTMLEVVAGGFERGEKPLDCAKRELAEETGHQAAKITKWGYIYPAPGYTDEVLYLFFARLKKGRGKCSPDEDEELEVVYLTEKQVDKLVRNGEIHDAKTLSAWLLWKVKRPK